MDLLEAGDVDRALVEFRNVFDLNGRHREARLTYARIQRERGAVAEAYSQYLRDIDDYYAAIDGGHLPIQRGLALSAEDRLRRDVITRLICHFRLDMQQLGEQWGIDFHAHFAAELAKLAGMEQTIEWFGNPDWGLGLPFPEFMAWAAARSPASFAARRCPAWLPLNIGCSPRHTFSRIRGCASAAGWMPSACIRARVSATPSRKNGTSGTSS